MVRGATDMITIYHLETSRSERIVWLMEELGLKYELEVFPRETTGAAATSAEGDSRARQGAGDP